MTVTEPKLIELTLIAIQNLKEDLDVDIPDQVPGDFALIDELDSMDLVNLIMETERLLEIELGRYVALADDSTFDASESPFKNLLAWQEYVCEQSRNF